MRVILWRARWSGVIWTYGYIILSFDFCGMIKLYLVMSYHPWSDMHLNHACFVFWLFSSWNDLFFLHCNLYLWRKKKCCGIREMCLNRDAKMPGTRENIFFVYFWRKKGTLESDKCVSVELLFNCHYYLSNLILHWVILELLLFLLRRKRCIYTSAFPDFSFNFLSQYWLSEMNKLESWIYLQMGNYNISGFCIFCSCSRLFLNSPAICVY